ncbi:MAG: hypothetical protein PVI86_14695 [Phycisphaerae bacterium]|jgi:hypothetical protein
MLEAKGQPTLIVACCWILSVAPRAGLAQSAWQVLSDRAGDALARPTDPGADAPFDLTEHRAVDLRRITLGTWRPSEPEINLFSGEFRNDGAFLRLDVVVEGLANPPGDVDPFRFDPFRYGEHPVYGFVEIDMDGDVRTGGELDAPEYRYLGNIARFGGRVTRSAFQSRAAVDGSAFDGDFLTPPFVERHGEEFHLVLLGWQFDYRDIVEIVGDRDGTFEEGEIWNIRGPFFHRAHGFEAFSFVEGGHHPGEYAPKCDLRFRHDAVNGVTVISVVLPLTNVGAGLMRGEQPEPMNHNPQDHASVYEALRDLRLSAAFLELFPTGLDEEQIISGWAGREPAEHLDPRAWEVTALFGTSFMAPDPAGLFFLWTDVFPNVAVGDMDGSGGWSLADARAVRQYIRENDQLDGVVDDKVRLLTFASGFSMYDVNYDGEVSELDIVGGGRHCDNDSDGDLDLRDVAALQTWFDCTVQSGQGPCARFDVTDDGHVDLRDFRLFEQVLTGPEAQR